MNGAHLIVVVTPDRYDLAIDALWQMEPVGVHEHEDAGPITLTAAFSSAAQLAAAATALAQWGDVTVHQQPAVDWVASWRANATPTTVEALTIGLPEHHRTENTTWLTVEPGEAFGHGAHPTTAMLLQLMQHAHLFGLSDIEPMSRPLATRTVADIGTGTGVLALAAAALGADTVDAVDIDHHAVDIARANCHTNQLQDHVSVHVGTVGDLEGRYQLVLANLIAGTLLPMAADIMDRCAPGGTILISGLRDVQRHEALAAFVPFEVCLDLSEDEWIAFALRRANA